MKGKKAIANFGRWAIAFVIYANVVVVYHNALKTFKRSFAFIAQSQWHLSITKQETNSVRRRVQLQTLQKPVVVLVVICLLRTPATLIYLQ
ncbi:hypothetical protein [Nostoc sp. MG11]|uniref:hypothetical protein n=1 Tax=Nostoc sp. MG11 TaxID=2721166 RepID=UPI0018672AFF|nr:hypothetical protein [Nostoc sp. MG11]